MGELHSIKSLDIVKKFAIIHQIERNLEEILQWIKKRETLTPVSIPLLYLKPFP